MKCWKVKFSKKEAQTALNIAMKQRRNKWRKESRYYQCPNCGYWHLTKEEPLTEPISINLIEKERWENLLRN